MSDADCSDGKSHDDEFMRLNRSCCFLYDTFCFLLFKTGESYVCSYGTMPLTSHLHPLQNVPPVFEPVPWRTWRGMSWGKPPTSSAGWLWPPAALREYPIPPGQRRAAPRYDTTGGPTWATQQHLKEITLKPLKSTLWNGKMLGNKINYYTIIS